MTEEVTMAALPNGLASRSPKAMNLDMLTTASVPYTLLEASDLAQDALGSNGNVSLSISSCSRGESSGTSGTQRMHPPIKSFRMWPETSSSGWAQLSTITPYLRCMPLLSAELHRKAERTGLHPCGMP
eukprot:4338801-Amphidinium_carterae.1